MLKRYHHIVGGIFRTVDSVVIGLVWLSSYWLRFNFPIFQITKGFPRFEKYAALCPLVVILWSAIFAGMRVYQSKRMLRRTDEAYLILKAHSTAMLFFIALTYLFTEYKYSRGVMLYFGILGGFFLVIFRLILRNGLRTFRRQGYNLRHLLCIGEGEALSTLIYRIEKFPELGLRVIGTVTSPASTLQKIQEKPVLGHFEDLKKLVMHHRPDQVLIALPRNQYSELDYIFDQLKDETIDLQLIPDIHEYVTLGCVIEEFDGLPIVNINDSPLEGWGAIAKRATDIAAGALSLLLLSPLILFIAILVKLNSKGPIFYKQERMGLDGRTFWMYKFRSMKIDAECSTGAIWAQPQDLRRTSLGTFLRKTSLDELPQLWNVLSGDMSLVGPRPERPVFVRQFRKDIPNYMLRHKVKAGMTGWAQVNGWRGNTSLARRIECDLFYIRNWSYLLDLKIITMTLWRGFINKNAY